MAAPVRSATMLRDLIRPRAIVSHLLVLGVAVGCVWLGQWQLDRLATVRESNQRLEARLAAPPVHLATLVAEGGDVDDRAYEFRRVELRGTFRTGEELLQRNREHRSQTGFHVLTPLELADGRLVLVRRGWVPSQLSEPPVAEASPPDGEVVVEGVLERPVSQPSFGARDPAEGRLKRVFHADTARIDEQVAGELFPMVVRLERQDPPTEGPWPAVLDRPERSEANHLSYAVQWHSFAVLALITYAAWLRQRHRRGATGEGR